MRAQEVRYSGETVKRVLAAVLRCKSCGMGIYVELEGFCEHERCGIPVKQ